MSILHQLPEATPEAMKKMFLKSLQYLQKKLLLESLFNNVAADADDAFMLANLLKGNSNKTVFLGTLRNF